MKIRIWMLGKGKENEYASPIDTYIKRISSYVSLEALLIPIKEGPRRDVTMNQTVLEKLGRTDRLFLLDEQGTSYTSPGFANFIQESVLNHPGNTIFLIGGAYGFTPEIYQKADGMIALSRMTLPHQLARLVFIEQLYRAFSILNNSNYHHI